MVNLIEMTDHEVEILKEGLDLFKTMILAERRDGWSDFKLFEHDMETAKGLEAKLDEAKEFGAAVKNSMLIAKQKIQDTQDELNKQEAQHSLDVAMMIDALGTRIQLQDKKLDECLAEIKRLRNSYIA